MGSKVENYCDGCGDGIGEAHLSDAIQITALGTNGTPTIIYLCIKPVAPPAPDPEKPEELIGVRPNKVTGCAKKVLSKTTLGQLWKDVAEFTGDEDIKPFMV